MKSYNEEHDAFVSNLKGCSAACVLVCLLHGPALILLLKLIQNHRQPRILRDYIFLVLPLLAGVTIFADAGYLSLALLLLSEIYLLRRNRSLIEDVHTCTSSSKHINEAIDTSHDRSFVTLFKGFIMLFTCISILAVDFRIFPRRFAKTEMFGISLMDVGIGGFIVSSAITSKYARHAIIHQTSSSSSSTSTKASSYAQSVLHKLPWHIVIVLLLGIGRMIMIRIFDYHEKTSEYGQHWNFFVTLSCIWFITDILHMIIPRHMMVGVSMMMLLAYQVLLSQTKLTYDIFSAPRSNFFWANREGICSLCGYVPLYLIVESFSSRYIFSDTSITSSSSEQQDIVITPTADVEKNADVIAVAPAIDIKPEPKQQIYTYLWMPVSPFIYRASRALTYIMVFMWITWLLSSRIQPASRRLTNITYILLILAMSSTLMLATLIADVAGGLHVRIASLERINKAQLMVFLGCNLITGAVNMSIKTIYMNRYVSFAILAVYSFLILAIAWLLQYAQDRKRVPS